MTSLLTSASTGLSTATSGVASLSTGLNKVNDDLNNATRYFRADGLNDSNDDAIATGSYAIARCASANSVADESVALGDNVHTSTRKPTWTGHEGRVKSVPILAFLFMYLKAHKKKG